MDRIPQSLINFPKMPGPSPDRGGPEVTSLLPEVNDAVAKQWPGGKWRYGSEDDLKQALAAMGPGAFVVGVRPLGGDKAGAFHDSDDGSPADVGNRELNHEHIFYLDSDGNLRDAGYFGNGIRKGREGKGKEDRQKEGASDELGKLGQYRFGAIENGGDLRPGVFDLEGFDASNYDWWGHNCQHYTEAMVKRLRHTQGRASEE